MKLRDYQQDSLDQLMNWFETHDEGHPIVSACVGAGKSVMIAELCRHCLTSWPGVRILMAVSSKELCEQNANKVLKVWPEAPLGVHSAGLKSKDIGNDIMYGTIGSIYKKAVLLGRIDLLMIDECHNVSKKNQGMYRQLINDLHKINPNMRVIGWTGTPFYGDGTWLTDADAPLFTHIAARVEMTHLLEKGYLSPLVPARLDMRLSSAGVKIQAGDYVVSDLAKQVDKFDLVESCADEIVNKGQLRNKWLVYCVTIEHSEHVYDALQRRGVNCGIISHHTNDGDRERIIDSLKHGELRCIVNVATLTTGFDCPEVDMIALLRSTKSPVLYVQIAGRGMRIADGKTDCLWLDFTDTTETLGPVDAITGHSRTTGGTGIRPFKVCEQCGCQCATAVLKCPECGHEFPPPERIKHGMQASDAAILSSQIKQKIEEIPVNDVTYKIQSSKKDGTPMLKVTYHCGIVEQYDEFVCLEHDGYAKSKAYQWWRRRSDSPVPSTAADAMIEAIDLPQPATITVSTMSKYPEILSHNF